MSAPAQAPHVIRFGSYTLDVPAGELHKNGTKIRLPEQPFQILLLLLERPGEVVTREEARQRLWSSDTFVDFETGLNSAVKKLRDVLGDSAEKPRFVETIPRHGYRFICPVNGSAAEAAMQAPWMRRHWMAISAALLAIVALAGLLANNVGGWRHRIFGREQIRRVVVLPFKNFTGDPGQEFLVDGMTDLVTTELAQVNNLSVISVTSGMHYKDTRKTLPEIARELNIDAAIEGSVQRAGNGMILTIQLVSAADRHLWAGQFDQDSQDVLALRSQIARNIVREINLKLRPEDEARLQRVRTIDPEAQLAYMKGRNVWWRKLTEEGLWRSIEFYQTAIDKDPNFAEAYSGMALSYEALDQLYSTKELHDKNRMALTKALELDPSLAEPHAILCYEDRKETECRRALELNPNDAFSHLYYAAFLTGVNRREESLVEVRRAEELDPLSAYISANVIMRLNMLRRFEDAVAQGQKALELDPDLWLTYEWIGGSLWHLKRYDEAIQAWEKVIALRSGYDTWSLPRLVAGYMKVGRKDDARKAFAQVREMAARRYVFPSRLALAYAAMGRKEEAISILQRARQHGKDVGPPSVELTELLGNDPRYQEIFPIHLRGPSSPIQTE
jgi:TolB-like protein/DNA-binding winged helix-turn-helix (wHTH) protein/Flp pilus assembly protein TadD